MLDFLLLHLNSNLKFVEFYFENANNKKWLPIWIRVGFSAHSPAPSLIRLNGSNGHSRLRKPTQSHPNCVVCALSGLYLFHGLTSQQAREHHPCSHATLTGGPGLWDPSSLIRIPPWSSKHTSLLDTIVVSCSLSLAHINTNPYKPLSYLFECRIFCCHTIAPPLPNLWSRPPSRSIHTYVVAKPSEGGQECGQITQNVCVLLSWERESTKALGIACWTLVVVTEPP